MKLNKTALKHQLKNQANALIRSVWSHWRKRQHYRQQVWQQTADFSKSPANWLRLAALTTLSAGIAATAAWLNNAANESHDYKNRTISLAELRGASQSAPYAATLSSCVMRSFSSLAGREGIDINAALVREQVRSDCFFMAFWLYNAEPYQRPLRDCYLHEKFKFLLQKPEDLIVREPGKATDYAVECLRAHNRKSLSLTSNLR